MERLPANADKVSFLNNTDLPIVILDRFLSISTLSAGFSFRGLESFETVGDHFLANSPQLPSNFSFEGLDHITSIGENFLIRTTLPSGFSSVEEIKKSLLQ